MNKKRKKVVVSLVFLLCSLIIALAVLFIFPNPAESQEMPYFPGEQFIYSIRKFGVQVGEATLEYNGETQLDGHKMVEIIFTAKGFNFFDEEKIYADPETLLPIRVERDLNIFGSKERLIEFYDPEKKNVRIIKYKKDKKINEMFFEQDQPIDNLYCFLYRYRLNGKFEKGAMLRMYLPTKDVEFKIIRKEDVKFYSGADQAWFMQSRPNEYRVWFGSGHQKMPLRIDGAVGLAKTAMILREYQSGKIE